MGRRSIFVSGAALVLSGCLSQGPAPARYPDKVRVVVSQPLPAGCPAVSSWDFDVPFSGPVGAECSLRSDPGLAVEGCSDGSVLSCRYELGGEATCRWTIPSGGIECSYSGVAEEL
jgi:hypothetical protein